MNCSTCGTDLEGRDYGNNTCFECWCANFDNLPPQDVQALLIKSINL